VALPILVKIHINSNLKKKKYFDLLIFPTQHHSIAFNISLAQAGESSRTTGWTFFQWRLVN
jgi:hypothetical protein